MDAAKAETLAFSSSPRAHWRQLKSTNPLERLNRELKRRCRVVGIFPTETSL
jgi:putative transposase